MELAGKSIYSSLYYSNLLQSVDYRQIIVSKTEEFIIKDIEFDPSSYFSSAVGFSDPEFENGYINVYPLDCFGRNLGFISLDPARLNVKEFGYYIASDSDRITFDTEDPHYIISKGDIAPDRPYLSYDLPFINDIKWASAHDAGILKNYCGPVSAANIILYLHKIKNSKYETNKPIMVSDLYTAMSTGKLGTFPGKYISGIKNYMFRKFPDINCVFNSYHLPDWEKLKKRLGKDIIISAYVWSKMFIHGAHYVNFVGWREYDNKNRFIRITDQWNESCVHFIRYDFSLKIHTQKVFSFKII